MKFIIFACTILVSFSAYNQSIDTLELKLNSGRLSLSDSLETLNLLSRNYNYIDVNKSLYFAQELLKKSLKNNDKKGEAYAYRNLASIYSSKGNHFIGLEFVNRSLDLFKGNADSIGVANCYITFGHIYRRLKNVKIELDFHLKALNLFTTSNDKERLAVALHNVGESFFNNKEFLKASEYTKKAVALNDSLQNYPVLMACYKVLGKIDLANGELDNANLNFNEVLKLSEKLGKFSQKEAHAESLFQLSAIALLKNDFEKRKKYLNTLVTFSTRNKLPNFLQGAYEKLLEEAIKNGNINEVNFFYQKFNEVSDSLEFIHILDQNKLATSISEVHQLNTINQKLTNEGINQKETIKERTDYLMLFLVLSALFLFLLIIVYRLSRRYKQQNEVIETQKVKLEKLNATKDKFFSIVAHDLKSPLNSLKSFSYLLVSHFDNLSKKEIIEMGQQLYNSVDITTKLADNLITWARMQMQEIVTKQESIIINEVINNCVALFKEAAIAKEIKISIKADQQTQVYFDKNQLEFIIRNLLNNAVKFTRQGGLIYITINELSDTEIELKVTDNGVGMPAEIIQNINDTGTKVSTKGTSGELGTGLGLMLCFQFARLNNTTLVIQSKLNKGTTIVLRLESY